MSFFSQLIELFESLFHGNSPEARQKQDLRKIETELKNLIMDINALKLKNKNLKQILTDNLDMLINQNLEDK